MRCSLYRILLPRILRLSQCLTTCRTYASETLRPQCSRTASVAARGSAHQKGLAMLLHSGPSASGAVRARSAWQPRLRPRLRQYQDKSWMAFAARACRASGSPTFMLTPAGAVSPNWPCLRRKTLGRDVLTAFLQSGP